MTLPLAVSKSTKRFISTSAEALVVVSELYCTTSNPSGLASVHTLNAAAWARGLSNSGASNRGRAARRMVGFLYRSKAHLQVQSGKVLP